MLNFKIIFRLIGITTLVTMMALPTFAQRKKKEEEQTKVKKAYNDLTHKYNAYFNANLLMNDVVDGMASQHQENYNQILPMYKHLALEEAASSSSDLDIIIKKSGVAVSLHRMSHWTDDSYLLIGQSEFLKGELPEAEGTFRYIISELDPKKLKEELEKKKGKKKKKGAKKAAPKKTTKKKDEGLKKVTRPRDKYGNLIEPKEEDKPKEEIIEEIPTDDEEQKYFLKHRPAQKEAILWLAKTQIAQEKYDEAFIILNRLRREKGLQQAILAEVEAAEAYAYLQQKEYERAIEPLTKAAALSKDRQQRMRYTYILGQLHQRAGRGNEAYATYEEVLKLRPLYEMEFNTRLSIAKNSYENGDASMDDAIRDLEKMLKDEKNEEYLDQIYFAMAEIELKRDNRSLAIQHLQKSVYNNINNKPQKAEAYYLLADLYYKDEVYTNSKYYYDSTLTEMAKSDERHPTVNSRSIMLKEIAENIEVIELQDSLIRIMDMSEEERMALAIQIREAEIKAKKEAAKGKTSKGRRPTARSQPTIAAGRGNSGGNIGTWWAYDADNVRKGKRDFEREWGQRRLSDDWRRSNRKNIEIGIDEVEGREGKFSELTSTEVDEIFKKMGVPQGETDLKKANGKISDAMASLGPLYRDRLKNNPRSIDILEQLMNRFPENKYKMESAYLLYIMYNEKPDYVNANKYKDLILKTDKESKFAKAITDPKFLEKEKDKQLRIQDYYNNAYGLFEKGNAKDALVKVDAVDSTFEAKSNALRPKFALLGAMCEGNLKGKEAYKIALNDVVKTYPKTDEANRAAEILKILGGGTAAGTNKPKKSNSMFSEEDGTHFFIATYNSDLISRNDITANFTDYNNKYHSLQRLRVNSIYLDLKTPVLVVKRFKSKTEAMEYYDAVIAGTISEFVKGGLEEMKIVPMVVSQDNYKTIVRKKAIKEYLEFFNDFYK